MKIASLRTRNQTPTSFLGRPAGRVLPVRRLTAVRLQLIPPAHERGLGDEEPEARPLVAGLASSDAADLGIIAEPPPHRVLAATILAISCTVYFFSNALMLPPCNTPKLVSEYRILGQNVLHQEEDALDESKLLLCRDRGRDTTGRGTPRSDPDGRLLAHPVLISDDWRQSDLRDKDGVRAVEGAIGQPGREHASMRAGVSGCGGGVYATTAP